MTRKTIWQPKIFLLAFGIWFGVAFLVAFLDVTPLLPHGVSDYKDGPVRVTNGWVCNYLFYAQECSAPEAIVHFIPLAIFAFIYNLITPLVALLPWYWSVKVLVNWINPIINPYLGVGLLYSLFMQIDRRIKKRV